MKHSFYFSVTWHSPGCGASYMPKKFRGNGIFAIFGRVGTRGARLKKLCFFVCSGTLLCVSLSGPNGTDPAPKTFADMEFLAQYNLTGIVIGLATFLIIGLFHPLVIRGRDGARGDRRVDCRAACALVDAAGRMGRLVAVEHRRAVRAAQTGRPGLVPEEPCA